MCCIILTTKGGAVERFGEMFKRLRIESKQTLRSFCLRYNLDPGNISKLERGRVEPPDSQEIVEQYAEHLRLERDSAQWRAFLDAAAAEKGRIPSDLFSDEEVVDPLPVLFWLIRDAKD